MHYPEYQIYESVQSYSKHYPEKTVLYSYSEPRIARIPGFEPINALTHQKQTKNASQSLHDESIRRTKTTIADLITCNKFDLFVTFTFDPKKVDRNNPDLCKKKMSKWLNKQRETHGKFHYLIVPEFHKDKKAIHFHALFKGYNGKKQKAITKQKREVFNIKSYRLGYSTAIPITHDHARVGNYVKKYITKDMPHFAGRKRYWCSTELIRPITVRNPDIDPFTRAEFIQKYNIKGIDILERPGTLSFIKVIKGALEWQKSTSTTLSTESTSTKVSLKHPANPTNTSNLHSQTAIH